MNQFVFVDYHFDEKTKRAVFRYQNNGFHFTETIDFGDIIPAPNYNPKALEEALFLAFIAVGTSYYKAFPTEHVRFATDTTLTPFQAEYFTNVYQEGLSQLAYEAGLTRDNLATFTSSRDEWATEVQAGRDSDWLLMQSGGKDSILTAAVLREKNYHFDGWHIGSRNGHPLVIDRVVPKVYEARREIDIAQLQAAQARNWHIPITAIVTTYAIIEAILLGKNGVIVSVAHEGEEPHAMIDDLPVNHQWSKTWQAEQLLAEYVERYIMKGFRVGSILRSQSELRVAELFVEKAWANFGHHFTSCNIGNYKQGHANEQLLWCGDCSKCLNSFLLFAPFVEPEELKQVIGQGENLLQKPSLQGYLKGLLGLEGIKPFECVGEIDELRAAYHMAVKRWPQAGYQLDYAVPETQFDYRQTYPHQTWVDAIGVL